MTVFRFKNDLTKEYIEYTGDKSFEALAEFLKKNYGSDDYYIVDEVFGTVGMRIDGERVDVCGFDD